MTDWEATMHAKRWTNMTLADHAAEQAAYRRWADVNVPPGVFSYEESARHQAEFDKWYATQPRIEMMQVRQLGGKE